MRPQLLLCAILTFSTAALAAPSTGVTGDWMTPTHSVVRIGPCGADICLTLVRLAPSAPEKTDEQNPDATLRNRPLCGLTIGSGFHQDDPSHLSGGHLYDPKSGHTYKGTITSEGDTLHLRGYIGISLFGRSENWTRTPTVPTCTK